MRQYGVAPADIRAILANPTATRHDRRGNPKVAGSAGGRSVIVVLAADDPSLVITVYPKRRA
jgi:hypothetical protein